MVSDRADKPTLQSADLQKADERYHFKLSDILRQRRLPLLLVIDHEGELLSSSVPDDAVAHDHRLLGQALAEARSLFHSELQGTNIARQLIIDRPGERCALVFLENEFYSLKLFPLHGPIEGPMADVMADKYAALVEPIVKPLSDGVDFQLVEKKWRLSKREVDVLKALMTGASDKEIARLLNLSVETIRAYLKSVRAKLGVGTRTAIVHVVHMLHGDRRRGDSDRQI